MMKLTFVPDQNNKKITVEDYKKYLDAKKSLKDLRNFQDKIKMTAELKESIEEIKQLIKDQRVELREEGKYFAKLTYKHPKKWNKVPEIKIEKELPKVLIWDKIEKEVPNKPEKSIHWKCLWNNPKLKIEQLKIMKEEMHKKFREGKDLLRKPKIEKKNITIHSMNETFTFEKCGAAIHIKNYKKGDTPLFVKFLKAKDRKLVFNAKVPEKPKETKYIGVECEFFCDLNRDELSFKLLEAGLHKTVQLKGDGSIRPERDTHSHELCILFDETDMEKTIKKVCDVLKDSNAKVNDSCGMHVHLDMRNRNHENAFTNLAKSQELLYSMIPQKRRTNTYCKKITTTDFKEAVSKGDRYSGINATAFGKYKTLEVRIHSGSIMEEKMINWVKVLTTIVSSEKPLKKTIETIDDFQKAFKIEDQNLIDYMKKRVELFSGKDNSFEETGAA